MIDSAFSGPIDTVSFAGGLQFTPVRLLSAVPFLRFDAEAALRRVYEPPVSLWAQPDKFALNQNFPNPFNPTTTLSFVINQPSLVTLKVYDILGREVALLVDEVQTQGTHVLRFDASRLSSGVYVYRLVTGGEAIAKKMTLVK